MIGLEISLHSFHLIGGNCSHFPAIGAGSMYLSFVAIGPFDKSRFQMTVEKSTRK